MNSRDFILDIIAALNKQLTKRQLKSDLKLLDNSLSVKILAKLTTTLSRQQLKKDLKKLNDLYVQIGANINVDKETKNQLQKRIKELQNTISDIEVNLKVSKSKVGSEVESARKTVQARANKASIGFDIEVKRSKAIADIEYLGKRFSKLFTNVAAKQKYENILASAYSISDENQLRSVRNQIAAFTSELKANGLASQSLGDKWRSLIDRSKDLFSAASIITVIFSQVKKAISTFLQLDTAMTNLYKVTGDITSRDQFSGLLTKWNKLAQNLAVTTESLINSAAEWSKIGFNLDMSEQLAQVTAIFEKTAEISTEKATSTLISAAQAFTEIGNLGEDDYVARVEAIGDRINAIGNKYSISSEGIANGLQNASAALKVAGNDLDETISLITATNKIFQSPEEASNMLKVASMRLRGQVDALKEMGEDAEGLSTDITKIQQQVYELTGNKVNIFEDEDTLKSTYQMILEIGEVFDSLNDRSQAELLEVIFGKQRSSAGASLLLNYEELEKIKNDSINAANSMAEEYSKYMESAEAHITIFKEKLVETYSTFMSGDLIKYTADVGSGILELVNSTDLLKHGILAVLALNIGKGITSFGTAIATTANQMNTLGSALQQVKNLPIDEILRTDTIEEIGESTKSLTEKNLKLLLSQKQLSIQDKTNILTTQGLTEEEAKAKLQKMGLITTTKAQSAANMTEATTTTTLKNAMTSLKASIVGVGTSIKAAFLSNPLTFILTGLTTIISVVTTIISNHNQKLEEARQKAAELTETYKQQQATLDSQVKKYKELKESLDRGNLSTDEARSIKEQLLEIQNSLIDSYGNEASNIDLVNGKYREQLGLLSELSKEKATDYVTENRDIFANAKKELEKIRKYDLGTITSWSEYLPKTGDQQKLIDYIESYSDLLNLTYSGATGYGVSAGSVSVSIKADAKSAEELMYQFAKDLEEYSESNSIDVSGILDNIPEQLRKTQTDKLKEYREIYDEYLKAEIIKSDTLRPLYQQSIQVVEEYNKALSSGEGITGAKANLDSLQQSVQNATSELEGSQAIFDDIYDGINKNAEAAYHLGQAFENDSTVQKYAEQLRGLSDIDIKTINLDNENLENGEEAFRGLLETLGYTEPTEEQIQNLIDKLVELEYVIGENQKDIPERAASFSTQLTNSTDSLDKFQSSVKSAADAYTTLLTGSYSSSELLDSIQAISKAASDMGESIDWESISTSGNPLQAIQDAIESVSKTYADSVLSGAGIDSDSKFGQMLANIVQEAYESEAALSSLNTQVDSLQSAYSSLTDIIQTYNETGYITFDQLQTLLTMEPQYIACLMDESGQLQLNQESMLKLANQRLDDAEAQAVQQAITELGTAAFQEEQTAVEDNAQAFSDAVDDLSTYNESLAETIATANVTTSEIRKLNDAINGAESEGATDDQINSVLDNLNTKLKLIQNTRNNLKQNFNNFGKIVGKSSSDSSSSASSSTETTKEFSEELNWVEKLVNKVSSALDKLKDKVSNTYIGWSIRNHSLLKAMEKTNDAINVQQQAYEKYMQKAASVGLSQEYVNKIQNGSLDIEDITDEVLNKQIETYTEW